MGFISKFELKIQLQALGVNVTGNYVKKSDIEKVLAGPVINIDEHRHKKLSKELEELEEEYGDSSDWENALFDDFDYWVDWQAGNFYASHTEDEKRVNSLLKAIKNEKTLDQVLWGYGKGIGSAELNIEAFSDKFSFHDALEKLPKGSAYFTDSFPESGFDWSAYGYSIFDLSIMESNLKVK